MKPKPLASLNHFTVPLLTCGVSFQDLFGSAAAPQFGPHTQTAARFPRLRRTFGRPTETTRTICSIGRERHFVKGAFAAAKYRRFLDLNHATPHPTIFYRARPELVSRRAPRGPARCLARDGALPTLDRRPPMFRKLVLLVALALFCTSAAHAAEAGGTKMLRSPTVSATQIAFAYAQNIWVVDRAGG